MGWPSPGTYVIKMGYIVARSGSMITYLRVSWKTKILKFCGNSQCKRINIYSLICSDIVIVQKKKRECQIYDVVCPGSSRGKARKTKD